MPEPMEKKTMTCGEYLDRQRSELMKISDFSMPGAVSKAEKCLSSIYAVSYQMNFERREPPSPHRGPAENEALDEELVKEMSDGLRDKAHAFQDIVDDPRRLDLAVSCACKGNGFALIEMVSENFLARNAQAGTNGQPARRGQAEQAQQRQAKHPAPAGPGM